MKIIIVEDDLVLGGLLKGYLSQIGGYEVHHVEKGKAALKSLETYRYDCAFVDLQLPDMTGIAVLEAIKSKDPTVSVIMMSGRVSMDASIEAMRLGASDFLAKPFTFQQLAFSLERAFRERQILLDNISLMLEIEAKKELERLNKELEQNLALQKLLFDISREFDDVRSSEELYQLLVRWALNLTNAKEVGFFVILPSNDALFLLAREVAPGGKELFPKVINLFHETHIIIVPDNSSPLSSISSHLHPKLDLILGAVANSLNVSSDEISLWPVVVRTEVFGFVIAYDLEYKSRIWVDENQKHVFEFLLKKASLVIENLALYESLMANFYSILRTLVNALEAKDIYTGKHSERVTKVAAIIAKSMGRSLEEMEAINTVGYLHDIGKIGIPDHVLNKPGRLNNEEFELIKRHPVIGESIVGELGLSDIERSIIRNHHERWDGKGYPDKIGGNDIPLITRVITVADAYDAMATNRPYRKALSKDAVWNEFAKYKGSQFDPQVIDALFDVFDEVHHEVQE
ncbi:MAG: HD domain-containing phosphohydrolase [Thermodesulforhabdaceae bacterium]